MNFETFTLHAKSLLEAARESTSTVRWKTHTVDSERVIVLESGHLPALSQVEAALVVRGDFSCGARCEFPHPVFVAGNCEIGKGSRLEGVTAGGALTLCPGVKVSSVAHSGGPMELRSGCRIEGSASSESSIRLSIGASAAAISAPGISTPNGDGETILPRIHPAWTSKLGAPGNRRRLPASLPAGLQRSKLHPLGAETWFYDGDLHLVTPLVLRSHIVVRGYFTCPAGSLLEGDVKCGSALYVGERSIVRGHLTARGDLVIEADSAFQGKLASDQRIRLCTGVRGLRSGGPVEAHAGSSLLLEDGVSIQGSLSAEQRVETVASERMAVPDLLADAM